MLSLWVKSNKMLTQNDDFFLSLFRKIVIFKWFMSQVKNSKAHGDHLYLSKIFFFFLIDSTSAGTWFWRPHHVNFFNVGKFRTYFFVKTWGEQLMKQNCRNFSQFFWRHKVSIRGLEENWLLKFGCKTKVCVSNRHSKSHQLLVTKVSKKVIAYRRRFVYQNRSDCHLAIFCIDCTANVCCDFVWIMLKSSSQQLSLNCGKYTGRFDFYFFNFWSALLMKWIKRSINFSNW